MRRQAAAAAMAVMIALTALFAAPASAIRIEMQSGGWRPAAIVVERFAGEEDLPFAVSGIVARDLTRSGAFRACRRISADGLLSECAAAKSRHGQISPADLSALRRAGGEYLLTGAVVSESASGPYRVTFELIDAITEETVGAYSYSIDAAQTRVAAHAVANWVYEAVTGEAGVFHTKIAFVVKSRECFLAGDARDACRFSLNIADYDGYGAVAVLVHTEPIISPAWTPDGNELLYVSFENKKPVIYRQSLLTAQRRVVANFRGNNSAPAMSPDMRGVAAALTKEGGTQIYIVAADGRNVRRLRESAAIDTEPDFSPDGARLLFMSDESGAPQIYEMEIGGAAARRLTFGARYNASPKYSRGGKHAVFIRRGKGGGYNAALLDLADGATRELTDIRLADSPSFSPNDAMILFKDEERPAYLFTVSVNGRIRAAGARVGSGEIIDPVWGPAESDWY
jgi:TolB protein